MQGVADIGTEIVDSIIPAEIKLKIAASPSEEKHIRYAIYCLKISLHWMIKLECKSKHKIPAKRSVAQPLKPQGKWLGNIFLLCGHVHSRQSLVNLSLPYNHAIEWFIIICCEFRDDIISEVLTSSRNNSSSSGNSKGQFVKERLADLHKVNNGVNPLKEIETMPHFSLLIDSAITLSERHDVFSKRYFNPFMKDWRDYINSANSPSIVRYFHREGKLYYQMGRGKSAIAV
jgi:hypothetical protein